MYAESPCLLFSEDDDARFSWPKLQSLIQEEDVCIGECIENFNFSPLGMLACVPTLGLVCVCVCVCVCADDVVTVYIGKKLKRSILFSSCSAHIYRAYYRPAGLVVRSYHCCPPSFIYYSCLWYVLDLYTAPPGIKHIKRNGGETGRIYRIISNPEKKKRKEIETIQEI
jgi:hypothetical protein